MKSFIAPTAIIFALIVVFFIVDRKEFHRHNDVQTIQSGNSTTIGRHVTAAEMKPAVEKKPFVNPQLIETKPTETKPPKSTPNQEVKSVAGTMSEDKLLPLAIPVVTEKEAKERNEEAKEYALTEKERNEPFYKLYEGSKSETVCFEGTVRATSAIPSPETNDYDNCLYTIFVELNSVFSDSPSSTEMPCEVVITAPIMKDKKIIKNNRFLPGDIIRCVASEYDAMPPDIQSIQLSDDIQSYEHQQYYPIEIRKITAFQNSGNRNFSKREITILPIQTLPRDEKAVALREERIRNEIARIEEELKKHGGSFESWKMEYKPIEEKYEELCNQGWKGWIKDCFFAAGGKGGKETKDYDTKTYIESIRPYHEYLKKNNIDLIILRVPSKGDFAARVLTSDSFQENPAWLEHYYECLKNDIEIIDPMPEMWEHRFDFTLFYFYHVADEIHPSEGASFIASKCIASILKRYQYEQSQEPILLEERKMSKAYSRSFYPDGNPHFNPSELIQCNIVTKAGKTLLADPRTDSPFFLVSNSLFIYPDRGLGACIPSYTAYFLKAVPDHTFQRGQYNDMLRTLITKESLLANRKAIVMGEGYFMWNGFPSFPKYLVDKPQKISLEKTLDLLSDDIVILNKDELKLSYKDKSLFIHEGNPQLITIRTRIPAIEKKSTCIVRIIFDEYDTTFISIQDAADGSMIESSSAVDSKSKMIDCYVPVSNKERTINIRFDCASPGKKEIERIELWYY